MEVEFLKDIIVELKMANKMAALKFLAEDAQELYKWEEQHGYENSDVAKEAKRRIEEYKTLCYKVAKGNYLL